MSVLVLGGSGRMGRQVVKALQDLGIPYLAPAHAAVDVTRTNPIRGLIQMSRHLGEAATTVINLTAYHDTKGCEKDPARAFRMNAEIPQQMALACASHGLKFVHFSTDYVFGGMIPSSDEGYTSHDAPAPVNVYGASKAAGELLVLAGHADSLIVRVSSLFGSPEDRGDFVKWVRERVREDKPITVVDDVTMSPTYTRDAANVLVTQILPHDPRGIIHLNNTGVSVTWYEFARYIATLLNGPTEFVTPTTLKESGDTLPRPPTSAMCGYDAWPLPDWRVSVESYLRLLDNAEDS